MAAAPATPAEGTMQAAVLAAPGEPLRVERIPMEEGAILGCAAQTAFGAVATVPIFGWASASPWSPRAGWAPWSCSSRARRAPPR